MVLRIRVIIELLFLTLASYERAFYFWNCPFYLAKYGWLISCCLCAYLNVISQDVLQ
jgi:hypothetical protein